MGEETSKMKSTLTLFQCDVNLIVVYDLIALDLAKTIIDIGARGLFSAVNGESNVISFEYLAIVELDALAKLEVISLIVRSAPRCGPDKAHTYCLRL